MPMSRLWGGTWSSREAARLMLPPDRSENPAIDLRSVAKDADYATTISLNSDQLRAALVSTGPNGTTLNLLSHGADAVTPGAELTYRMTFGYRADAPSVADSRLRFRLPAGVSFLAATAGGVLDGDFVAWDLGLLNPGDGGIRAVTVQVGAPDASVLQAIS